jgi:membrane protease YdiL (CAAX protease family)
MPLMLGYLFYQGKQRHGRFTLDGIIHNRRPMPIWQYALLLVALLGFAFLILFLTSPVNEFLSESVFAGLPDYFKSSVVSVGVPSASLIMTMLVLQFFVDGQLVPIVEELYYRGHLMPRIAYLGWLAPVFNALLFTIQHFWQPYNYLLIFLIVLPQALIVWRKKNIYIAMLAHCAGNTIGAVLSIIGFLYS